MAALENIDVDVNVDKFSLKRLFSWKSIILLLFGILLMGLYAFFTEITLEELLSDFLVSNKFYIVLGFLTGIGALLVDGFAWWLLLKARKIELPLLSANRIFFSSWVVGMLVPSMGLSESVIRGAVAQKVMNENKKTDFSEKTVNFGEIFSTIILHRLLGSFAAIVMAILAVWSMVSFGFYDKYLKITPQVANLIIIIIAGFALLFMLIALVATVYPHILSKLVHKILKLLARIIKKWEAKILGMHANIEKNIFGFSEQMKLLTETKLFSFLALICVVVAGLLHVLKWYFFFQSYNLDTPFLFVLTMGFLLGNLDLLPLAIPGMEGIKELGMTALLVLRPPYDSKLAFSAAVMTRFFLFYVMTALAIINFYLIVRQFGMNQENTPATVDEDTNLNPNS